MSIKSQAASVFADASRWQAALQQTMTVREAIDRKFEAGDLVAKPWLGLVAQHYAETFSGSFEFMVSMREQANQYSLTPNQAKGVLNSLVAELQRNRPSQAPGDAFPNVAEVKDSRYRVVQPDGKSLSVRIGPATWAQDKPKGTRGISYLGQGAEWQFAGFVDLDGNFRIIGRERRMLASLRQAFEVLVKSVREGNWLVHALAFSMEGSVCCFCGRDLDTAESISVGYGPICAAKYGLPWGEVAEPASVVLARDAMKDGGIRADAAHGDDWEGPATPEYSETDDEAREEMERDDAREASSSPWQGHRTGTFESGRSILRKAGKTSSLDEKYGKTSYRPGRTYDEIFGEYGD